MRQELNFEQIGKNIRAARIQKNLTQEYLADTIDVNVSHISNIENNRVKVSLTALVAICNVLNVSVDYILKQEYTEAATASAIDREILKAVSESPLDKKKKFCRLYESFNTTGPMRFSNNTPQRPCYRISYFLENPIIIRSIHFFP